MWADSFRTVFETLNCFLEIVCWFHSEISDCGHDVRGGRQGNRRSGYHLQVEMEQRHVCVNMESRSLTQVSIDNDTVLSDCVLYLFSSTVYPVHQQVSTLTLLIQVQLQLSNSVLQKPSSYTCPVSEWGYLNLFSTNTLPNYSRLRFTVVFKYLQWLL